MIEILSLKTKTILDKCVVSFDILEDGQNKNLWLKINSKYEGYVVRDRVDGIVVGLLNYAMRHRHDIRSRLPISDKLMHNLTTVIVPALTKANKEYYTTNILCPITEVQTTGYAVGTGISCGVDSLYALASAQENTIPKYRVTHLVFNNVGQHGDNTVASTRFNERLVVTRQFAKEYGFELVECDSNYHVLFPQNHLYDHTYANLYPILTLGNLFNVYYYGSSGILYSEMDLTSNDPGSYEPLLLPMLSTSSLTFYSGGANTTRMDKLKKLIAYPPSYKYLQVCVSDSCNCGKCEKCVRTQTGLEALNALDKYKEVFNLSEYYANHNWQMRQMYYNYLRGIHDYKDIYPLLKHKISLIAKVRVRLKLWIEDFIRYIYPLKNLLLPNIHLYKQ